jgi:hypothetical protein
MQNKLTIIDIVAKGTIDEVVIAALKSNKAMNSALTENLGFDPKMLGGSECVNDDLLETDESVIVENGDRVKRGLDSKAIFQSQRKDECILAAIAMACRKDIAEIRDKAYEFEGKEWKSGYNINNVKRLMCTYLNDNIAEQFQTSYIDRFQKPYTIEDLDVRHEELKKIALDMSTITTPTRGRGFLIVLYHTITALHIVYYEDGWIYDSNSRENDKIEIGKWLARVGDLGSQIIWKGELV